VVGKNDDGDIVGSLVQGSAAVDDRIDTFFGEMSYTELKDYAKSHNGYYYFDGTNLFDAAGKPAVMPDMISDYSAAAGNSAYDPLAGTKINDRILFVDSKKDINSTSPDNPFTQNLTLPTFWKGVVYVNGSIQPKGSGNSAKIAARTPDEFKKYRQDGSSSTHEIKNVLLDGIIICQGVANLGGNAAIYGTLAARDGVGVGGTPSIFYNSANGEGRLKDDSSQNKEYRVIAGRLTELAP
jgi:hypothetical protein